MRKTNRKGFTIVELVIVIAVIAILAGVLIPTFASVVKKATIASDTSLVKNLNTALAAEAATDGANATAHDAMLDALENGYSIEKLTPTTTKYDIVWDSLLDRFALLDEDGDEVFPKDGKTSADVALFKVYDEVTAETEQKYSIYLSEGATVAADVVFTVGVDVGVNENVDLSYNRADATDGQTVIFRTNGGTLTINAPKDNVSHYGTANVVNISAVAGQSYYEYGKADFTKIESGHYEMKAGGSTNALVVTDTSKVTVTEGEGIAKKYENLTEEEITNIQAGATMFAGGLGTADDPYIIETAQHLQNINEKYESGFNYFKVKDGVEVIDCSNWPVVKLNGSFDGNGVKLTNLTSALFNTVGYQNGESDIAIKNLDATMNVTNGNALVRNLFNAGTTTFENVHVHGYIEGAYNMGSFYNYGTANYDDVGCDYAVTFVNSTSDATLVCTTGNGIGGMIGHGYEGTGNTLTLTLDDKSTYTGKMYTTTGTNGKSVMYMCSNGNNVVLNNETWSTYSADNTYTNVVKLEIAKPVKGDSGYTVDVQPNVASITASVNCQITATDKDGNKIPNLSGMTWVAAQHTFTEFDDVAVVFESGFESGAIVNGTDHEAGIAVVDGVLTLYTGSSANYTEGTITLFVNQYDANGNVVSVGSVVLTVIG